MYILGISIPLMCLLWHVICCILTIVDYVVWVRLPESANVRDKTRDAEIAFGVIGIIAYAVGAGPLFVYAYKYGLSLHQRRIRLVCGIAIMFFAWSFPLFIIQMYMFRFVNAPISPLEGIVFVLSVISLIIGGSITWFSYMKLITYYIHHYHGIERQINPHDNLAPYPMVPVRDTSNREDQPDTI